LSDNRAAFIYSPELEKHGYPAECPFNTSRAAKVRKLSASMGFLTGPGRCEVPPEPADRVTLKKFHTARYLHALKTAASGKWDIEALHMGLGTPDCPIFKGMYDYAVLAAGATLTGAKLILDDSADIAFNPSGGFHHAGPEKAAGFCYINDVALACHTLADAGKRVLYLDIDVHFGDGVAYSFYDRSDVLTISFHESPRTLFPGTGFEDEIGQGEGRGYCVNFPLPIGTYDKAYMKAFNAIAVPLMDSFDPDVIVFELGADTLSGDPLAHLYLTNNTYAEIIRILLSLHKPLLVTGGGGYNVENTVRAWAYAWSILCGAEDDQQHDLHLGLGGVMLESTDWQAGLRDRQLIVSHQQKQAVDPAIDNTIQTLKDSIFPIHGL
jgi:acetoin utilization protein AcuC